MYVCSSQKLWNSTEGAVLIHVLFRIPNESNADTDRMLITVTHDIKLGCIIKMLHYRFRIDQRGCVAQGCRVWPSPAWCFIYQNPMLPSTTDLPIPETTYYWTLGKQFILILPPGVSLSFGCGFSLSVEICFKYPSCSFHWCSAKSFGMSSFAFLFTRLSLPSD